MSALTVRDVIEQLSGVANLDAEVVMSRDAEGNGFSPLEQMTIGWYVAETTWSGEFSDEEEGEGTEAAVCLWPVN